MAYYNETKASATPLGEGVRFEIGAAAAYAVRNEERNISVRVRREGHFLRNTLSRIPLARGVVRLLSAFTCFFGGLNQSARMRPQQVVRGSASARCAAELFSTTPQTLVAMASGLMIPIILGALLIGLPMLVEWILLAPAGSIPRFAVNTICCAFRMAGAVLSVYAVCRLHILNRLCMYRGAASKVLNACEAYGPGLTHEDALLSSRLTDKSDGAFCIVVLLVSIAAFSLVRTEGWAMQIAFRLGAILAAAAVSNEFILPLERAKPGTLGATLRIPLVGLQHLFTIEPHNQMIEVAICAFRAAYENDVV